MRGLKLEDLVAILDFLYHGETKVLQEKRKTFLDFAAELRVKGLTRGAEGEEERVKNSPQRKHFPLKRELYSKESKQAKENSVLKKPANCNCKHHHHPSQTWMVFLPTASVVSCGQKRPN